MYSSNFFINFKKLIFSLKNILPLFLYRLKRKGKVMFITGNELYSKTVYNLSYLSSIKELVDCKLGIFSNFFRLRTTFFKKLDFNSFPAILVFFCFEKKDSLLLEAKKKKIPIVGLVASKENSSLVDYPVFLNSEYFHSIYFFSRFLFRLIILGK